MERSSSVSAKLTWQRALQVLGILLILLGASGYLVKRSRVSGQVRIGGAPLNQVALKTPVGPSPTPDSPGPAVPISIDEAEVRPGPRPTATPQVEEARPVKPTRPVEPIRPARPIRPIRPVRPDAIVRPSRPEAAATLPNETGTEQPGGAASDEKKIKPAPPPPPPPPPPVPVATPTPAPTPAPAASPRPKPTPGETLYYRVEPTPTPTPALFHQEEVEGDYPGRLEKGAVERVRIRFVRKMVERPRRIDQTTIDGDRTGLTESIEPVPGRPLDVAIEQSYGSSYQAWIRCSLRPGQPGPGSPIEIIPAETAVPAWRELGEQLTLDWEWTIRTTSPALHQELTAEMEIEWRPLDRRAKTITHQLWRETLTITVADPLLKSTQLDVVSPLLGGSGALLMLIGALPIGRRRFGETIATARKVKKQLEGELPVTAYQLPSVDGIVGKAPDRREMPKLSGLPDLDAAPPDAAPREETPPVSAPARAANLDLVSDQSQDIVECSVFAPPLAPAGETIMIQVFAHLEGLDTEAAQLAAQFDPSATSRGVKTLASRITRGTELTFHLELSRIEIAEPIQSLVWMGDSESVQFIVDLPTDCRPGNLAGKVTISQNSVPIGRISFLIRVAPPGTPLPAAETAEATAQAYRYTFISYASEDRDQVLARVQMLDQMGIKYFQDVLSLDPGQRWEKELYKNIDRCDLFLLFWSTAAKKSEWVMREIDYAISRKHGQEDAPPEIKPVIIEGPPLVEPPAKLRHLHFNDRLIYLMNRRPERPVGG